LLRFCLANRKSRLFKEWKPHQIAYVLTEAYANHILHVVIEDTITGMVIARPKDGKQLCVEHILCTTQFALKTLLAKCAIYYPDYLLVYKRRGKDKTLKQERMWR
jgi:hypothetical protein